MDPLSADNFSYDDEGQCQKRKRKSLTNLPCCCPVCGITVRPGEWAAHYSLELDRLFKYKLRSSEQHVESDGWSTYLRIRGNRLVRLRSRNRKEVTCPVCNKSIHGTAEELNQHVERCLIAEEEEVDVEGNEEMYEEYEWAGQSRVRATTLVPGGFAALGVATKIHTPHDEEDEKVVVDVDESIKYGASQYSDQDIAAVSSGESASAEENGTTSQNPVIEVLKTRIKNLECESEAKKVVCLICMDSYKTPVVSILCWHVHCEECWLHTLGAKKLCPQCNMITSPSDLRRIYL